MREQYEIPEMEIIVFGKVDIVTTSEAVQPDDNWWGY